MEIKTIKVPSYVLEFDEQKTVRTARIKDPNFLDNHSIYPYFSEKTAKLYVEHIGKSFNPRKISRDEMTDLVNVMIESNYADLNISNVIVAKDAIYLIDHEPKTYLLDFHYEKLYRFESLLEEEDKQWFKEKVDKLYQDNLRKNLRTRPLRKTDGPIEKNLLLMGLHERCDEEHKQFFITFKENFGPILIDISKMNNPDPRKKKNK